MEENKRKLTIYDWYNRTYVKTPTGKNKTVIKGSKSYNKLVASGYHETSSGLIMPMDVDRWTYRYKLENEGKIPSAPPAPKYNVGSLISAPPLGEAIQGALQKFDEKEIKQVSKDSFRGFNRRTFNLRNYTSLESYYQAIEDAIKKINSSKNETSVVIRLVNNLGELRHITVNPVYLQSFGDFSDYLESLFRGDVIGSDAIGEGHTLDTSYLSTINYSLMGYMNGNYIEKPFFAKYEEMKDAKKLCLWRAVFSQINYEEDKPIDSQISDLAEMRALLHEHYNVGLTCVADYLHEENIIYEKIVIDKKPMLLAEIKTRQLKLISDDEYARENNMTIISVVYYNNHFIADRGVNEGRYFIDSNKKFYHALPDKPLKIMTRAKMMAKLEECKIIQKDPPSYEIVTYDLETIYDDKYIGLLKPYSISWTYQHHGYFYMGDDCLERFINFLTERSSDTIFCLLGYNSSRFDNIFLIPVLIKLDLLSSVFYQKNSVLNLKWGGRHTVHDICRFTSTSLEVACNEFRTKFKKVEKFTHAIVQSHFNRYGNVNTFFHDKYCPQITYEQQQCAPVYRVRYRTEQYGGTEYVAPEEVKKCIELNCECKTFRDLVTYNLFDVFSCEELYLSIEKVLRENQAIEGNLFDYKTIGSIIYRSFIKNIRGKVTLPDMDIDRYRRVRSGLIAGRTQCYKGVSYDLTRKNKYRMLDVKSLYPYVMLYRYYPCGEMINIDFSRCKKRNLIGFYNCRVNQANLNKNVIPLRLPKHPLDWNYKGDIITFINTVDIACLIDAGAEVEILKKEDGSDDGFAFSEVVRGDVLFSCQLKWKRIKEEEDVKKAKGQPFNVVLRNMAKTFLNSLSGKVIENIHIDTTKLVRNKGDMEQVLKETTTPIKIENMISSTAALVSYTRSEEKEFNHQNRPIYLGTLIYAYARDHMYRNILANYDVIYQDTDSALISFEEYERFKQEQPEMLGESFGQFALEDHSELFDSYITLSPKNYFIMGEVKYEENDIIKSKYDVIKKGFKGVNLKKDKYIPNPELYYKEVLKSTLQNGETSYDVITRKAFNLYHGEIDYDNGLIAPKSVYKDFERFISDIIKNRYAYVLTSSLVKTLRNFSEMRAGNIYQRFLLKKVKIDSIHKESVPFIKTDRLAQIINGRYDPNIWSIQDVVPDPIAIELQKTNWDTSQKIIQWSATFRDANMIRLDLGGTNGNRCYNFSSYDDYVNSRVVNHLLEHYQYFNLNEYPYRSNVDTRVWFDIDMKIEMDTAKKIVDYINQVCPSKDNKFMMSDEGKMHIIMDIHKSFPIELYDIEKKGKKNIFIPTGEIVWRRGGKYDRMFMMYFKQQLLNVIGAYTDKTEWDKAFDVKACGLRALYSLKIKSGKLKNYTNMYKPIYPTLDATTPEEKAAQILDYSIYKPATSYLTEDVIHDMNKFMVTYEKELAKMEAAIEKRNSNYKLNIGGQIIECFGVPRKLTQTFIDERISELDKKMLEGSSWHNTIRNIAILSHALPTFSPKYILHEWSKQSQDYNEARNDDIWAYMVKNKPTQDEMSRAASWLCSRTKC